MVAFINQMVLGHLVWQINGRHSSMDAIFVDHQHQCFHLNPHLHHLS
uniref:Uncharacterized protein n=1 Tax=Arundo donax TaxID=35708 RepID=A0A0A9GLY1_ARUDO